MCINFYKVYDGIISLHAKKEFPSRTAVKRLYVMVFILSWMGGGFVRVEILKEKEMGMDNLTGE